MFVQHTKVQRTAKITARDRFLDQGLALGQPIDEDRFVIANTRFRNGKAKRRRRGEGGRFVDTARAPKRVPIEQLDIRTGCAPPSQRGDQPPHVALITGRRVLGENIGAQKQGRWAQRVAIMYQLAAGRIIMQHRDLSGRAAQVDQLYPLLIRMSGQRPKIGVSVPTRKEQRTHKTIPSPAARSGEVIPKIEQQRVFKVAILFTDCKGRCTRIIG